MPQPIHFKEPIQIDLRAETIMQRPHLAKHIALISALWNQIDSTLASLLTALLGTEARVGMTMYFAIQADTPKRAVLDAIASMRMTTAEKSELQTILLDVSKRVGERNDVIHGAWGISPMYPDKLLWCDPRDATRALVGFAEFGRRLADFDTWAGTLIELQKRMLVYEERDFINIEQRLTATANKLQEFCAPFLARLLSTTDPPVNPPQGE
jgi:hypothetical protein